MAGEWIAVDLALDQKPEVQELIDTTGQPVEVVVYRLLQLWGWASMHCADGTARMTIPRLVRTCGGDDAFWRAVAAVGWLEIDETAATVAVPGWDRRFSQAAKSRLQHRHRAAAQEESRSRLRSSAGNACAQAQAPPAPTRSRGEERREEIPPPPREAWETFRAAWNADGAPGRPWKASEAPSGLSERLLAPGGLSDALEALERLRGAKFFATPVTLIQFTKDGFIERLMGGQYDTPKGRPGAEQNAPPAHDPSRRRWYRAEFGRSMTDAEFSVAIRQRSATGPDSGPVRPVVRVHHG